MRQGARNDPARPTPAHLHLLQLAPRMCRCLGVGRSVRPDEGQALQQLQLPVLEVPSGFRVDLNRLCVHEFGQGRELLQAHALQLPLVSAGEAVRNRALAGRWVGRVTMLDHPLVVMQRAAASAAEADR